MIVNYLNPPSSRFEVIDGECVVHKRCLDKRAQRSMNVNDRNTLFSFEKAASFALPPNLHLVVSAKSVRVSGHS